MEVDPHLAGNDLRERRLAEAGRTKKQDVVEGFAPADRGIDKDPQIVPQPLLADERVEGRRPNRVFRCIVLDLVRGDDAPGDVAHCPSSSKPAFTNAAAAASPPSRCAAAAIAPSASARPTPRFSRAETASAAAPGAVAESDGRTPAAGALADAARPPSLSLSSLTMRAASRAPTPSARVNATLS